MAKKYRRGDRVKIVAGKYKENKEGEVLKWSGAWSASVRVKGDTRPKRILRLTSLHPWPVNSTDDNTEESKYKGSKEEILADIHALTERLKELELKVRELI